MISDSAQDLLATKQPASRAVWWRFQVLAFVPTLILGLCALSVSLPYRFMAYRDPSGAEDVVTIVAWIAGCVPFAMPVYLYFLGRRYVRVVHAGLKGPGQFAFMYGAANVGVWLLSSCLLALSYSGR